MIDINDLKPFPKFCYSIGYIPTSYKVSMTYEEQLVWLCDYLQNTVIPAVNNNGHAVEELQNLFVELKQYVDDYFSDLNVQTEINNKLDDMAESGQLADIINEQIFSELNAQVQTNSSDIDTLETNLTNFQSTFTTFANQLEEHRNPIDFYNGKNFVVFGDSYSQAGIPNSEDEYWVKQVAQATGMTKFNFAIAGAGFGRSTNLLTTQLTTADSQMTSAQKTNTAIVIVYAGYNDIVNDVSEEDILSNYIALINGINTSFPNAKIIVAPFNWQFGSLSRDYNDKIETLIYRMHRDTCMYPVVFLKLARYWLLGINTNYRNSNHPSVSGYKTIASYMIGAIYGSSEHVSIGWGGMVPSHGNQNIRNFTMKDGYVHFNFGTKFDEALTDYSGVQFANLHALLCPETDIFIPLYKTNGFAGTLILKNNGTASLQNINCDANEWILGEVTFPAQAWKAWQQ